MGRRRFQATEQTIYRDLQATCRYLGATALRIAPRNLLDPEDIEAEITFDRSGRRYVFRCRRFGHYLDNLRAAERVIYYLHRALFEYGVITSQEQADDVVQQVFAGFEATPDDSVLLLASGLSMWWEVLGVTSGATRQEVVNAYRALARVHHPDGGGQPEDFRRLRVAYEAALEATRQAPPGSARPARPGGSGR